MPPRQRINTTASLKTSTLPAPAEEGRSLTPDVNTAPGTLDEDGDDDNDPVIANLHVTTLHGGNLDITARVLIRGQAQTKRIVIPGPIKASVLGELLVRAGGW